MKAGKDHRNIIYFCQPVKTLIWMKWPRKFIGQKKSLTNTATTQTRKSKNIVLIKLIEAEPKVELERWSEALLKVRLSFAAKSQR